MNGKTWWAVGIVLTIIMSWLSGITLIYHDHVRDMEHRMSVVEEGQIGEERSIDHLINKAIDE